MNAARYLSSSWQLAALIAALVIVVSPHVQAQPTASPTPSTENVTELSAKRAASESGKIQRLGVSYTRWLDRLPGKETFLRETSFQEVTWMRLIASAAVLLLTVAICGAWLRIVRRRAGQIESKQHQSWPALAAAALRKPVALLGALVGAFFIFMPIVLGLENAALRTFLAQGLATVLYGGRVIALLWVIFQAIRAVEKRMRRWAERSGRTFNIVLVPIAGQSLRLIVPLCAIILLLPLLNLSADWTWVAQRAVSIFLIAGVCAVVIRGTKAVQSGLMASHKIEVEDNLAARQIFTRVSVIRRIVISAVILIGGASILMLFGPLRQFGTSILASAGIAGVVLGFAAQKTLGNILAGIQIALSQPMLIDDIVVVEGEFGRIEEITLTYVVVRTWDLRRLVLPITYFIEKPFQNWSRRGNEVLGTVYLYLDYQMPLGPMRAEMKRLVENNPNWDGKVCALQVTDTKESSVQVRALVSSADASKLFDLRCQVREGLIEFLRARYPESLPRTRTAFERLREEAKGTSRPEGRTLAGQQHERGSVSPGLEKNAEVSSNGRN